MPNLTFVLPHSMYWLGLLIFPLAATYIVKQQERRPPTGEVSLPIGYFLWLTGGFVGLHRLYLRSYWGLLYVPLFVAILLGNRYGRSARDAVSEARRELSGADFRAELAQEAVDKGTAGAAEKLAEAQGVVAGLQANLAAATARLDGWQTFALSLAIVIGLFLLVDAWLLPRLIRTRRAYEAMLPPRPAPDIPTRPTRPPDGRSPWVIRLIDMTNSQVGNFIAYWSVIAVFVYYYEVLARYVFNSPTNWAHESMFLMFGMQYLLAGGFAYHENAHVRVDVLYSLLSRRRRALVDVITSAVFFVFTATLLWTGTVFTLRSVRVFEVSFTEWAIQYWPVKGMIAVGAFLILIQGISHLFKNLAVLTGREA